MDSICNPVCATCPQAYNSVNGRRCTKYNKIVEYTREPLCETENKSK